jgi:cytochrome c oxidase subunit 2
MTPTMLATSMRVAQTRPLDDFLAWFRDLMTHLLYLPVQASSVAASVDGLQLLEFTFFWLLGFLVLGSAGWFAFHYRRRGHGGARTPRVEVSYWVEATGAVVLLAIFVAFWVVGFRQYIEIERAPEDAIEVYVTGRRWMWKFGYPQGPTSAGVLYVPLGRPVRLVLTSRDVIHSFYVPAFRVKQDAVPGRYTTIWFSATREGVFDVLCAEYCGTGHSRMRAEVMVMPADRFERWLQGGVRMGGEQPLGAAQASGASEEMLETESLADRGMHVAAARGCLRCHTTDGTDHVGPTWKGLWHKEVRLDDGTTVTADAAYITRSMMDPMAEIVAGYPAVMPTYQGVITPGETAAIIELIKQLQYRSVGSAPPTAGVPHADISAGATGHGTTGSEQTP